MKKIERGNCVSLIAEDGMSLCQDGKTPAERIGSATVVKTDVGRWGEIPVQQVADAAAAQEHERAYKARVEALIAERYTLRDEMAIQRQRESKPEEFAAYNDYAEACKIKAREELSADEQTTSMINQQSI